MPYTKFAFFAYRCATATNSDPGHVNELWPQNNDQSDIARVIRANQHWIEFIRSDDAKTRLLKTLKILDEARRWANDHYYGPSNVLKIFVIPEFYFRPNAADINGEKRYTEYDGYNIHLSLLKALSDPIFSHWVIVPGTVISTAQMKQENFTINIGILIQGGTDNYLRVVKHNTSPEDGVNDNFQGDNLDNFSYFDYEKYLDNNTDYFLSVDGKTFGLEICLDHSKTLSILKHNIVEHKDDPENQEISNGLDFHIVTSAGIEVTPTSVAAKTDGYIFRLDGKGLTESRITLKKVEQQVFEDVYWYSNNRTQTFLEEEFYDIDSYHTKRKEAFINTYRGRSSSSNNSNNNDNSINNSSHNVTTLSEKYETQRFIIPLSNNIENLRRIPAHPERIDISPMYKF